MIHVTTLEEWNHVFVIPNEIDKSGQNVMRGMGLGYGIEARSPHRDRDTVAS